MTLTDEVKVSCMSFFAWNDEVSFIFFLGTIFWKRKCVKILPLRNPTHAHVWDAVYLQTFPRAHINFRTAYTRASYCTPAIAFITVYKYPAWIMRIHSKFTRTYCVKFRV